MGGIFEDLSKNEEKSPIIPYKLRVLSQEKREIR